MTDITFLAMETETTPTQEALKCQRRKVSVRRNVMAINKQHLAARLIELRDLHRLGQKEAANRAGISDRQWTRLERMEIDDPHHSTLDKITQAFDLEDGDLQGIPKPIPPQVLTDLRRIETKLDAIIDHLGVTLALPAPPSDLINGDATRVA